MMDWNDMGGRGFQQYPEAELSTHRLGKRVLQRILSQQHGNNTMKRSILLILFLLFACLGGVRGQNVPYLMNYQGELADGTGTLLNGNFTLTFRIYSASVGGTLLWGPQTFASVPVVGGRFNATLGLDVNSIPIQQAFTNTWAYLEIQIGANNPIAPRQQILSSPYSLRADNSDNLAGTNWTALFPDTGSPATGHIPATEIAANSITAAQIAGGAIGSAQIANGAVGSTQIANGAVGSAQIAAGAVGTAQIGNGAVGSAQIANAAVGSAQMFAPLNLSANDGNFIYYCGFNRFCFYTGRALDANNASSTGYGIIASGANGIYASANVSGDYAGDFSGDVNVSGAIFAGTKDFKIDHPLDPSNKYFYHSCIESSDRKNLYDGVTMLDAQGAATIELPAWFEALNQDFRYQLTAIGAPGPNLHIAQKIANNHFKIAGGTAGMEVSWQVTGVRHDAYAIAHPLHVEDDKPAELKGYYLHPKENGQPIEKGIDFMRRAGSGETGPPPSLQH
jgi:hypothetical protein